MDFCLTHPEMVERLILVDSVALPNANPSFTEYLIGLSVLGELFVLFRSKLILKKFVTKEFYYRPEFVKDEMLDPLMQADRADTFGVARD